MTIQITLLGADGVATRERTFQQSHVSVGGDEDDDFVVPGLPPRALFIVESASGGAVESGRTRTPLGANEPTVLNLGMHKLRVCVFTRVQAAAGACPRCGGANDERSIEAGYRTMIKRERECRACGTTVLELADAERSIGAFAERAADEWLMVTAPMACPECRRPLTRTTLRTAHGHAEVERCITCAIVVLEKSDRAVLAG